MQAHIQVSQFYLYFRRMLVHLIHHWHFGIDLYLFRVDLFVIAAFLLGIGSKIYKIHELIGSMNSWADR